MRFIESKRTLKTLACFGIAVPIIDVIVFYILGSLTPGYDPLIKTISELGEAGTQNALFTSVFFIKCNRIILHFASSVLYLEKF